MNRPAPLTRWRVYSQSWPIMLANAAAPIVGLIDTFVIGRFDTTTALAGIGLGAVIYSIVYWGFGFLRMSTAGLAAQSEGMNDQAAIQAHIMRAIPIGLIIGLTLLITQTLWLAFAFHIYTAPSPIELAARTYIEARLWGLPATLASIVLMGWFVGIGRAHHALIMQIALNIINAALSLYFVTSLGWGLFGVGLASAIAEWVGLITGLALVWTEIKRRGGLQTTILSRAYLLNSQALKKLGITNSNIFIRTLALTAGFNFFGNAAAMQGEVFLAGNHILMQFITMVALILDAFAHTAEATTGAAYGAKHRPRFNRAVRLTSEFSALFGVLCGLFIYMFGPLAIMFLTDDPTVQTSAMTYLPWCALAPVLGFAAWQFDGIFIGTTHTREMRNASLISLALYIGLHYLLTPLFGAHGLWMAFLGYYVFRALSLAAYYPGLLRHLEKAHAD